MNNGEEKVSIEGLGLTDRFSLMERCIQEGVCSACGSRLTQVSANERKCESCGFTHYSANPDRSPHATE
jgi:ribosomal protein L40E